MANTRTLHGFHCGDRAPAAAADSVHALYVDAARADARARDLAARATAAALPCIRRAARLRRSPGHANHQGVVAVVDAGCRTSRSTTCSTPRAEPPLLVVLDGVTDPHNLGACLRSADAFGAHALVVPKDRAVGVNATVAKAASGAADTVPSSPSPTSRARCAASRSAACGWWAPRQGREASTTPSSPARSPGCSAPKARACGA
jgi:23S rRNA (guanosine2251-2'-O)-methyltransferase